MKASIRLDAAPVARKKVQTEIRTHLFELFSEHAGVEAHADCAECKLLKHILWWIKQDFIQVEYRCECGLRTKPMFREPIYSAIVSCPRCGKELEAVDLNATPGH